MNLDTSETWQWIWLVTAAVFVVAEIVTPRLFFFLPFALGAAAAALAAFAGLGVGFEWLVFVAASGLALTALLPVGRRLNRPMEQHAIGANRWIGREAYVVADIPA